MAWRSAQCPARRPRKPARPRPITESARSRAAAVWTPARAPDGTARNSQARFDRAKRAFLLRKTREEIPGIVQPIGALTAAPRNQHRVGLGYLQASPVQFRLAGKSV